MINSQDIKKGTAIRMDGGIWVCIDFQHRKPGKGNTIMIIKVKNVSDGRVLERRFNIGEKLEDVVIERRPYQYLYEDQSGRIFMNQETFEQIPIDNELVIGHEYISDTARRHRRNWWPSGSWAWRACGRSAAARSRCP